MYDPEKHITEVFVSTEETTGLSFWIRAMIDARQPELLVGYSGCGKTAVAMGVLGQLDPDEMMQMVINLNYYTDSAALQKVLESPLEKKVGKSYAPVGTKHLVYFVDDLNMPKLDQYNTQTPIALLRQLIDSGEFSALWHRLNIRQVSATTDRSSLLRSSTRYSTWLL